MNRSTVEIYERAAREYEARREPRRRDDAIAFGRDVPAGAIREGGYSDELPEPVDAFLSGWSND